MRKHLFLLAFAAPLALAACGETTSDRVLGGAGVGAAAGTVGAAVVGAPLLTGAAVGAAAGAVTGAVTDSDDIDLGKPWWKRW
jgi:hypothetical protein